MDFTITGKLKRIAEGTSRRDVKNTINSLLDTGLDMNDPRTKKFVNESLSKFKDKDKLVKGYLDAEANRKRINDLGISKALAEFKNTKIYKNSQRVQEAVTELVTMKEGGAADFKILDTFNQNIQEFTFDDFYDKHLKDINKKKERNMAYHLVESAIEELGNDPNVDLYGDIMIKLENAMALPANLIPFFLYRGLAQYRNANSVVGALINDMAMIDNSIQNSTLQNVRYEGSGRINENVVCPVLFSDGGDFVMLGGNMYKMDDTKVQEANIDEINEPSFLNLCNVMGNVRVNEATIDFLDDEHEYKVGYNEEEELELDMGGQVIAMDGDWEDEAFAMGASPFAISTAKQLKENMDNIVQMDNIVHVENKNGKGKGMYVIKKGKTSTVIMNDSITEQSVIMEDMSEEDVEDMVMKTFGVDLSYVFDEDQDSIMENEEMEEEMRGLMNEIEEINDALNQIYSEEEEIQEEENISQLKRELEEKKSELEEKYEELSNQLE